MVDYGSAIKQIPFIGTDGTYLNPAHQFALATYFEKNYGAIRSALELASKVQSEIPATPLPEGMTRDLFADIKRIIADNERLKWRLAKYELPAAQTGETE